MHSVKGELTDQIEAFGVSVIEAMATALPVVSCDIGGVSEIVLNNRTGILITPKDIHAHADAFLRLGNNCNMRIQMGIEIWKRVKNTYSYEIEKNNLLKILI